MTADERLVIESVVYLMRGGNLRYGTVLRRLEDLLRKDNKKR